MRETREPSPCPYTSTGQGFSGNNTFVYCGNNSIAFSDYGGNRYCAATTIAGESKEDRAASCAVQNEISRRKAKQTPAPSNTDIDDAETDLDDAFFFFNDALVIRVPGVKDAGFSFGAIFIGENVNDPNLLKHEYGHIIQLMELGVTDYVRYVAAPSVVCYWATEAEIIPYEYYHSLPWEYIANQYGGATNNYVSGADSVANTYWTFIKARSMIRKFTGI